VTEINDLTGNIIGIIGEDCDDDSSTELDLSRFANLITFIVKDNCFEEVERVIISGLKHLEYVLIGDSCFKNEAHSTDYIIPNSHFTMTGCDNMKELKIGDESFFHYALCNITNSAIELISMGTSGTESNSFYYGSLVLRSIEESMK